MILIDSPEFDTTWKFRASQKVCCVCGKLTNWNVGVGERKRYLCSPDCYSQIEGTPYDVKPITFIERLRWLWYGKKEVEKG